MLSILAKDFSMVSELVANIYLMEGGELLQTMVHVNEQNTSLFPPNPPPPRLFKTRSSPVSPASPLSALFSAASQDTPWEMTSGTLYSERGGRRWAIWHKSHQTGRPKVTMAAQRARELDNVLATYWILFSWLQVSTKTRDGWLMFVWNIVHNTNALLTTVLHYCAGCILADYIS